MWNPCNHKTARRSDQKTYVRFVITMVYNPQKVIRGTIPFNLNLKIKDRAFELNSNYFIKATASSNPLMIQQKNEYSRGFSSRAITKATPLCASKDNIKDFYIEDLSQEDFALLEFEMSYIES